MMQPAVSVLMSAPAGAPWMRDTVQSVLARPLVACLMPPAGVAR
jgi:hypothetical protein